MCNTQWNCQNGLEIRCEKKNKKKLQWDSQSTVLQDDFSMCKTSETTCLQHPEWSRTPSGSHLGPTIQCQLCTFTLVWPSCYLAYAAFKNLIPLQKIICPNKMGVLYVHKCFHEQATWSTFAVFSVAAKLLRIKNAVPHLFSVVIV